MSEFNITVPGGKSKRLKTGGKYCPDDIVVTSEVDHTAEDAILSREMSGDYYNDRVTRLGAYALAGSNITSATLPRVVSIGGYAMSASANLEKIIFRDLSTGVGSALATSCPKLELVDYGNSQYVSYNGFISCTSLKTLILRSQSVVTLSILSTFNNTPFAEGGTGGTVYCPAALIEQYQAATNWSVLHAAGTCTFVAIEGSEYE